MVHERVSIRNPALSRWFAIFGASVLWEVTNSYLSSKAEGVHASLKVSNLLSKKLTTHFRHKHNSTTHEVYQCLPTKAKLPVSQRCFLIILNSCFPSLQFDPSQESFIFFTNLSKLNVCCDKMLAKQEALFSMLRLFRFHTQLRIPRSTGAYTSTEQVTFLFPPLLLKEPNQHPNPEHCFWWLYWDVHVDSQDLGSPATPTGIHMECTEFFCQGLSSICGDGEAAESREPEPWNTPGLHQWVRLEVTGNETAEFSLYKIYKFIFFL